MREDFDFTPVIETAIEHHGLTRPQAEAAFDGLLQWLSVIPLAPPGQPVQMVESIDRLWHSFILHTKLYRAFCERHFGRYIDHDPLDRRDAEPKKKAHARFTRDLLLREFGEDVHPAFLDEVQKTPCCYGQCDDGMVPGAGDPARIGSSAA
jgi:hypothetical protein